MQKLNITDLYHPSVYFNHPMIKKDTINYRAYQINIAQVCSKENTLVVLPTGLGKTVIALIVIAETLQHPTGKILFMAPTKPLVEQHAVFLNKFLNVHDIAVFTGEVPPSDRNEIWQNNRIIVSTPQIISNDILCDRIDLSKVSLVIFDEAHRTAGDYAYVFIGESCKKHNIRVLAMTASPGNSTQKISAVCDNLGVSAMELRTELDADVVNYVHKISLNLVEVEMTEKAREISNILKSLVVDKKKELQKCGFSLSPNPLNMKELLGITATIRDKLHSGSKQASYYHAITIAAMAMKINQAMEYVETQSIGALRNYMERLEIEAGSKGASKATKLLVADDRIRIVIKLSRESQLEHPKLLKVIELVNKMIASNKDTRIIVFTHYRDVSELVTKELEKIPGAKPIRFVGQATKGDDKGMNQKEQGEILQKFRGGEYNILVATSVAEEGLDIPSTDFVIFYEPVPSEIRSIQRRGRTGRIQSGRVYILVTKGTRDVPYFWSSMNKEKRMKSIITLKNQLKNSIGINRSVTESKSGGNDVITAPVNIKSDNKPVVENASPKTTSIPEIGIGEKASAKDIPDDIKMSDTNGQKTLFSFEDNKNPEKKMIIVDSRELNSDVARELSHLDFKIETRQLYTGDYILSDRVAVERKEVSDFLQSIIDGRLFQQIKSLKQAYLRPIVIIEGENLFTTRNINDEAIYGALASITIDFNIPVIFTKNCRETANFLASVYRREFSEKHLINLRGEKGSMSTAERQQFIIEGFPNISAILAQRLLSQFGSVKAITNATIEDLCEVKGVGKVTAEEIHRILNAAYYKKEDAKKNSTD